MIKLLKVIIHNNNDSATILKWLAKGARWIAGNGDITIDYEPWSCAQDWQKKAITLAMKNNAVKFTLAVATPNGDVVMLDYDPTGSSCVEEKEASVVNTKSSRRDTLAQNVLANPKSTHIVVAQGNKIADRIADKVTFVGPPKSLDLITKEGVGFNKIAAPQAKNSLATSDVRDRFEHKEAPQEEPQLDAVTIAAAFDALTAEKKWADALQLLIDFYGAGKITFTTRAIMALKTFEAVAKKYSL